MWLYRQAGPLDRDVKGHAVHTETVGGVHSVSWKLGPLLADGHFFLCEHRSAGFSFRVLGWICSPTRDAFSDFVDGPCAAPRLPWELSLLLFSFSLRFIVNSFQAVQTLVPFLSPKVRGRKVRFLFPQASAWVSLRSWGGVLREQILEPLLVNTVGGVVSHKLLLTLWKDCLLL